MTEGPTIVLFGGKALVTPDGGVRELRCVAQTKTKRRCLNWVETNQHGFWVTLKSQRGRINVYDMRHLGSSQTVHRFLEQHCNIHDHMDVIDHQEPEWSAFDPDGRHAALVEPLPALPATWRIP